MVITACHSQKGIQKESPVLHQPQELEPAPVYSDEYEHAPLDAPSFSDADWPANERENNYRQRAKSAYGIDIQKIFFGHNNSEITALLINTDKKLKEADLLSLQKQLYTVFPDHARATFYSIYSSQSKRYAIVSSKKGYGSYDEQYYSYKDFLKEAKTRLENYEKFKAESPYINTHQLEGMYVPLSGFSPMDHKIYSTNWVFAKDDSESWVMYVFSSKNGEVRNITKGEDRYISRYNNESTIYKILPNGDLVSISTYYVTEADQKYGSYFLRINP